MIKPVKSAGDFKGNGSVVVVESVEDILERDLQPMIAGWLSESSRSQI